MPALSLRLKFLALPGFGLRLKRTVDASLSLILIAGPWRRIADFFLPLSGTFRGATLS